MARKTRRNGRGGLQSRMRQPATHDSQETVMGALHRRMLPLNIALGDKWVPLLQFWWHPELKPRACKVVYHFSQAIYMCKWHFARGNCVQHNLRDPQAHISGDLCTLLLATRQMDELVHDTEVIRYYSGKSLDDIRHEFAWRKERVDSAKYYGTTLVEPRGWAPPPPGNNGSSSSTDYVESQPERRDPWPSSSSPSGCGTSQSTQWDSHTGSSSSNSYAASQPAWRDPYPGSSPPTDYVESQPVRRDPYPSASTGYVVSQPVRRDPYTEEEEHLARGAKSAQPKDATSERDLRDRSGEQEGLEAIKSQPGFQLTKRHTDPDPPVLSDSDSEEEDGSSSRSRSGSHSRNRNRSRSRSIRSRRPMQSVITAPEIPGSYAYAQLEKYEEEQSRKRGDNSISTDGQFSVPDGSKLAGSERRSSFAGGPSVGRSRPNPEKTSGWVSRATVGRGVAFMKAMQGLGQGH